MARNTPQPVKLPTAYRTLGIKANKVLAHKDVLAKTFRTMKPHTERSSQDILDGIVARLALIPPDRLKILGTKRPLSLEDIAAFDLPILDAKMRRATKVSSDKAWPTKDIRELDAADIEDMVSPRAYNQIGWVRVEEILMFRSILEVTKGFDKLEIPAAMAAEVKADFHNAASLFAGVAKAIETPEGRQKLATFLKAEFG